MKPLIKGEDVRRWRVNRTGLWLLYMYHGINIDGLDAVIEHLKSYRGRLEGRATKQKWYELQQPQYRSRLCYSRPKIVYPQIMRASRFAYDASGGYINQKCFALETDDLYLLGILNSPFIWQLILEGSPMLRGGYREPRREFILSLPIPEVGNEERQTITMLVQECLDAKGVGCEAWEAEINERVAALYGL